MILQAVFLLSSLVLALVSSEDSQCVKNCPGDVTEDFQLTLTPGESTVFCLDYQYYELEDEYYVALFNKSRDFCPPSDDKYFDPLASVLNIECTVKNVTGSSRCNRSAVAVVCEWSEDDVSVPNNALSLLDSDNDLRMVIQLKITNWTMTGIDKCNVVLNVSLNTKSE